MGKIVTFYSYKGGTGRSMALANVAWILASNGFRVLAVDWDLEAPGLHRYFWPFITDKELTAPGSEGLIDLMIEFGVKLATPAVNSAPDWYRAYADVSRWTKRLNWPSGEPAVMHSTGYIDFLCAGRQNSGYSERVNSFGWANFYEKLNGRVFIDALRDSMRLYDWVLIDSRTGVSDTAGICTIQLPDILVVCFTLNYQNIDGGFAVASSVRAQRDDIRIWPVPMRIDPFESKLLGRMKDYAVAKFTPLLDVREPNPYWFSMEVPYTPRYAYHETLASFEQQTGITASVLLAMELLTSYITDGAVRKQAVLPELHRTAALQEFEREPDAEKSTGPIPSPSPKFPKWTVMVYIIADSTLDDFAVGSLQELRAVVSWEGNVVVAAQFGTSGKQDIRRLIFEGREGKSNFVRASRMAVIPAIDMAHPAALRDFINWAYVERPADHYCLVLWGHGLGLFADEYPAPPFDERTKKFLTALDVKRGLAGSKLIAENRRFEIVAVDASYMSMMEFACELPNYAQFLVASQEKIPAASFPYDKMLVFDKTQEADKIATACQEMPRRYIDAYQGYILTNTTQTASITLSSLALKNTGTMTELLRQLASALTATRDNRARQAIIHARADSQAFVVGLYVDVYDFCERLLRESDSQYANDLALISAACQNICDAIQLRGNDAFIMANEVSKNKRCHGVSIYFPYLTDSAKETTQDRGGVHVRRHDGSEVGERGGIKPRTRGEIDVSSRSGTVQDRDGSEVLIRGTLGLLNKGARGSLNKGETEKLRRQRIEETEQFYSDLEFAKRTGWDKFIRYHWSRWLVEDAEEKARQAEDTETSEILDQRYSAQQCALNLLSFCRELEQQQHRDTSIDPNLPRDVSPRHRK